MVADADPGQIAAADHGRPDRSETKAFLVGGGIASLAAAAFLIRDGHVAGHNITILEELDRLGGSLDGAGSPEAGYVVRGGRMMESKYQCTYGLFSSIPTLDESRTVTQEILEWNKTIKTASKSRLVRGGRKLDTPDYGLSETQILTLERLAHRPGGAAGRQQHRRPVRLRVLRDQFLVDVVHDLRLPALAQRGRVQALSRALRAHGRRASTS